MTDTIYAVPGTFEDWSYAASWEEDLTHEDVLAECKGIDKSELEINENVARSITYLIGKYI